MIVINLLTPEKRALAQKHALVEILQNISMLFLLLIIFAAIVTLGVDYFIRQLFFNAIEQSTLVNRSFTATGREILNINDELQRINSLQNKFVPWSETLLEMYKLAPDGIRFTQIMIDRESRAVTIRGMAATRNSLIKFKEAMENSSLFAAIASPLSNLLARENITFEFQATLNEKILQFSE